MKSSLTIFLLWGIINIVSGQQNQLNAGATAFEMTFKAGDAHNHPSFAVWLEATNGNFIQTLFVTESVGTGIYDYKPDGTLRWTKGPGEARRPAALPYWFHKRDNQKTENATLPSPSDPVLDAYTGATPKNSFSMSLEASEKIEGKIRLLVEVNQPWDVNDFWTNNKYPGNNEYLTSCQPALVYAVTLDTNNPMDKYYLNPIGHSHPHGADGKLYTNLSTFTTALDIFPVITVEISR